MKMMTVGDFKTHFSAVLAAVKQGEIVVICYGKQKEKVAAIVPYHQIESADERRSGPGME